MNDVTAKRQKWNRCRFDPSTTEGHYESYFQRANHPERPQAFWIRYTIFCPKDHPDQAIGELWAMYFDMDRGKDRVVAVREEFPFAQCQFSRDRLDARVSESTITDGRLDGTAALSGHELSWSLGYESAADPLLMFEERLYKGSFPKAKAVVGAPNAVYQGELVVDGDKIPIDGWVGSQNHNWGSKHTDDYAWGQVAGFQEDPDAFLECATARLKLGPVWTPRLTIVNLRVGGETYALNDLLQSVRACGRYKFFAWTFDSCCKGVRIHGEISAPRHAFVGLTYGNPPGGTKTCLNTKVARCRVTLERQGQRPLTLLSPHRAAFEILTDRTDHQVPILT